MLTEGGGRDFVLNQCSTAFPWAVWQLLHPIIIILERLQHQNKSSVIRLQKPSQPASYSMGTSGISSKGKAATAYHDKHDVPYQMQNSDLKYLTPMNDLGLISNLMH